MFDVVVKIIIMENINNECEISVEEGSVGCRKRKIKESKREISKKKRCVITYYKIMFVLFVIKINVPTYLLTYL